MVWNVQGTGNKTKINAIKEVVKTYKPSVLALVETHMGEEHAIRLGNILGYDGQSRVNATGYSGVYASPDPTNRRELWAELEEFTRVNNRPWLLAGDFNETRSLSERHGSDNNMARRCERFNNWIEDCELIELAFTSPMHTWARGNSVETRQGARLDRALCNSDWSELFEDALNRELKARIEGCQRELPLKRINYLIKLEAKLRRELDEVLAREELLWYQKSRMDFIRDGDRNTSYFHVSTLIRRWRNRITSLKKENGEWTSEPHEIKEIVVNYYKSLYLEEQENDVEDKLPWNLFQDFSNTDWEWLTRPFNIAEIERVINNMGALKAPGPDGFQALFYRKNWETIADSLCEMVIKALEGKGMPVGLNDTHLVLIPKVPSPETIYQFRPISLCNVVYKIICKTLANRIKKVLPHLISETQSGFVPGRQITDNIVVFQKVIHSMRKRKGKQGFIAIKIDLEKAYDRLRWSFIRDTMKDMGFPGLLVDVVMECVTSTRMQVLWNGEPTKQFTPTRGVRQGDPLSSYLFVMCLEKLQQAIDLEVRNKNWRPIVVGRNGPSITNLFFADDMVLFGEANEEQALVMRYVLDNFCEASGEKISSAKSRVFFSSNTAEEIRSKVSTTLGFEETADLGTYLGMPTINGRVTRHTFAHLEEKMNNRLAGWTIKKLSLAGMETLVKSTLTTMANYSMQTAKIPRTICDSIDMKSRRFLWGGDENKKSIHLIKWETVQQPKARGGLGIVSARQANAAFLTKLGWRVLAEPHSLWSRVLRAKYCKNRCDIDIFQPKTNMSNVWAGISSQSKTIVRGTATAVGNGRRTLFWDHAWVDGICLSDHTLNPIPEETLRATVSDMWCEFNGWKWDLFADLLPQPILLRIASISLVHDPSLEDSLYWQGTSSGKFTIKSALGYLKGIDYDQLPESPVWPTIWRLPVQQRLRMFLWLAAHGRLIVNVNRVRRNMGDDPLWPRCHATEETVEHLLRSCPISIQIWNLVGINPSNAFFFNIPFEESLTKSASNDVESSMKDWPMNFAITCWWIWRWRNNVVFGREGENPIDPHTFLYQQFASTKQALDRHNLFTPIPRGATTEKFIRWLPPPHGWVMLNTDAGSKGNPGLAGGGGIFRDETGNFITAYFFSCGVCTSMKAEILALLAGLERAKELRIPKLIIHMDNSPCVDLINEDQLVSNSLKFLVKRCKDLLKGSHWRVKLEHTYREANKAADFLANKGFNSSTLITHLDIPLNELRPILREDIFGATTPRVIASI
ncbi:uncharacterized protein LOC141630789 [Silene latifolia]|uniref:uncharacterized protein LOC141630789 n=1 Tax=Silene latifolia TaxID=37657 RepID=UPI003D781542